MQIEITQKAAQRVLELLAKDPTKIALRVAVDGGGCSGFMYQYSLIEQIEKDDIVIERHDIKLAIDPMSQPFLENAIVEFIEELGAKFFQIRNPNATAKCGCGNSFAV